ncbi:MAG: hypothetical protein RL220_554 [Bacteroidota bacterium]
MNGDLRHQKHRNEFCPHNNSKRRLYRWGVWIPHSIAEIMCDILRLRIRLHDEAIDKSSAGEDVEYRENKIRELYREINFWRNKQ